MDKAGRRRRLWDSVRLGGPDEATPIEWLEAAAKVAVGAWYLMPFGSFSIAPHLYRYLGAVMPEAGWGLLMVCLGWLKLFAWYFDLLRLRCASSVIGAFFWGFYGTLLWFGDHRSSALVWMATLLAFEVLAGVWLNPGRKATGGAGR